MRLGLIGDLHGNLIALEAVLAALAAEAVDDVVCLGDVAATGPQPSATIARLRALGCPVVLGNADAWLLDPPANPPVDSEWRRFHEIDAWCAAQLTPDDRTYLTTFQPTIELARGTDRLICCHGSPRSYDDQLLATTPDDDLDRLLGDLPAGTTVVVTGHTHRQLLRRYRGLLLINPGSVGMAIDRVPPAQPIRPAPWAEYAVVTIDAGGLEIALRRVAIDPAAVAAIRSSGMPHAGWLIGD